MNSFNMMVSYYPFIDCFEIHFLELLPVYFVIKKKIAEKRTEELAKAGYTRFAKNPIV